MTWDGRLVDVRMGGTTPIAVRFGLERWARALDSFAPAFWDCIPVLESHLDRVFAGEGGQNVSGRWAGLSPRYAAIKAAAFPGAPILTRTGAIRRAFGVSSDPAAIRDVDSKHMLYGAAIRYARYHQDGTPRMPRRPILDFATSVSDRGSVGWALAQVFQAHVVAARQEAMQDADRLGMRQSAASARFGAVVRRPVPKPIPPGQTVARLRGMALH